MPRKRLAVEHQMVLVQMLDVGRNFVASTRALA